VSIGFDKLSFAYGKAPVLREISAEAKAGRITAIIGPNASGKSTLLRCGIGALRPQRGVAALDGHVVTSLSSRELARRIAYVPQRPIVSASFSVRQVIELGRFALPARAARIDDAIVRLDLSEEANRPYVQLSVGQQQRVALARALAQLEPRGNLVLDEPTSAMDLRHVAQTMALLRACSDAGAAVLLAMHDLSLAAAVADDVWLMEAGQLVASGPVNKVLDAGHLERVFGVSFRWVAADGQRRLLANVPGVKPSDRIMPQ
jgi:iron complex transport system ATP-binding protein